MNRRTAGCPAMLAVLVGVTAALPEAGQNGDPWAQCRPAGPLRSVPGLREASGLALSRTMPGFLWTHNDSGPPNVYAIQQNGSVTFTVRIAGALVEDWEAVAVGPCGSKSCLFVGDIGDNKGIRPRITVYRAPEPAFNHATVTAEAIHARYPDGPHDAEALLIAPDGGLFVVTKGEIGPVALYRFPRNVSAGATVQLERVGAPRSRGKGVKSDGDRITDGTVSPDGAWVALRTKTAVILYAAKDFFAGSWLETRRIDLTPLKEPQGEGVAVASSGTIYLATEGAGAGGLGRLTCSGG